MDWSYSGLTLKIFPSQHAIHWLVRPAASCRTEAGCWRLWTRPSWLLSSWEAWNMPGEGLRWSWGIDIFNIVVTGMAIPVLSMWILTLIIYPLLSSSLSCPLQVLSAILFMKYIIYFTILVILHWIMAIGFLKLCCFLWSRSNLPAQSWLCEFWFKLCFC